MITNSYSLEVSAGLRQVFDAEHNVLSVDGIFLRDNTLDQNSEIVGFIPAWFLRCTQEKAFYGIFHILQCL